jgi:hypothetical protein
MQFISPKVHGILDYSVALTLVGAPLLLGFADSSAAAAILSVVAGVGLFVYSLLTDYSAGLRNLIPFRLHLTFDAVAAGAFLVAPFFLGFTGLVRVFYLVVGAAVLAVVACTRRVEGVIAHGSPVATTASTAG